MYLSATIINAISISFPFITSIVYARLLLCIFCFKTIKKSSDLSLFYCKFALDLIISVISFVKLSVYSLSGTSLNDLFLVNHWFTFLIVFSVCLISSVRGVLVLVIAVDRVFATYLPIKFFKYRKHIPTSLIISISWSYSIVEFYMQFVYCGIDLNTPTECVNGQCVLGECYVNFWLAAQKVFYTLTIALTILLMIKLFIWNKFKKQRISRDLKRANRLALIDCWIIVIFELIPPILHTAYPDYFNYVGAINTVAQTFGFVVESYLCTVNVEKKYQTKMVTSTGNIVVRSQGASENT